MKNFKTLWDTQLCWPGREWESFHVCACPLSVIVRVSTIYRASLSLPLSRKTPQARSYIKIFKWLFQGERSDACRLLCSYVRLICLYVRNDSRFAERLSSKIRFIINVSYFKELGTHFIRISTIFRMGFLGLIFMTMQPTFSCQN